MVSTRSGTKRSLNDDESPAGPPKRARRTVKSKPARSLMALPTEIRRLILKELLWQEEPIEFNFIRSHLQTMNMVTADVDKLLMQTTPPARQFYPHILRVCKKLYAEGSDVLYGNTINCRIGHPLFRSATNLPVILAARYQCNASRLPSAVKEKMSKVRIQLFAHHKRKDRAGSVSMMSTGTEILARALRQLPAWVHICIQIIHVDKSKKLCYDSQDPKVTAYFEKALRSMRYIRNRSAVTITGTRSSIAAKLPDIMISTEPFVDLALAYNSLESYVRSVLNISYMPPDSSGWFQNQIYSRLNRCKNAASRGDTKAFFPGRNHVVLSVASFLEARQELVFEHDAPWSTLRPTLGQIDYRNLPSVTSEDTDIAADIAIAPHDDVFSDHDEIGDETDSNGSESDMDSWDDEDLEDEEEEEEDWDSDHYDDDYPFDYRDHCQCPHCASFSDEDDDIDWN